MQERFKDGSEGEIVPFEPDGLQERLKNDEVSHVEVFDEDEKYRRMAAIRIRDDNRVRKDNRQKNKVARKARQKNRRK